MEKFPNGKDCLQNLRVKKEVKILAPSASDFTETTKNIIKESPWP